MSFLAALKRDHRSAVPSLPTTPSRRKFLILALLGVASIEFVVRGPVRFAGEDFGWNDFIAPFVQSKAWLHGSDPYSPEELVRRWPADAVQFAFLKKDLADGTLVAKRGVPSPYPPTTFALLAPLALLPWRVAHGVWLLLILASFASIVGSMVSISGFRWDEPHTLAIVAAMLALAPFHTAIATGNIVLPAFACGMAGVWAANRNHSILAGILVALSACLKPPVGLLFLGYYLIHRQWRIGLVSTVTGCAISAVAIGRLLLTRARWLPTYAADTASLFSRGAINDFTTANPLRFHLLNLQMPLYSLLGSDSAANEIAWAAAAILLVVALGVVVRRDSGNQLLQLSALMIIAILPVYHRFVDAVIIALPVCWALSDRRQSVTFIRSLVLVSAAPFLIPGPALMDTAARQYLIPSSVISSWWWQVILLPHQAWTAFFMAVLLLVGMVVEHFREPSATAKSLSPDLLSAISAGSATPRRKMPPRFCPGLRRNVPSLQSARER